MGHFLIVKLMSKISLWSFFLTFIGMKVLKHVFAIGHFLQVGDDIYVCTYVCM